jgi:hypothetical protein
MVSVELKTLSKFPIRTSKLALPSGHYRWFASAGVDFPNSIDIGDFTGPNGGPLPSGVRISDAETGEIYSFTSPVLEPVSLPGGAVVLKAYVQPGYTYVIEASEDLVNGTGIFSTTATGTVLECVDPQAGMHGHRFYRLRVGL